MQTLRDIQVKHYTENRVPNPYPDGELPWQVYHTVRNAVVRTCRRHGPTGPMGECKIVQGDDEPDSQSWEKGDVDAVYFVVDDQYNHERYLYIEFEAASGCTTNWLIDICATLARFPGWGIGVDSLTQGYLLVFEDRLMVQGPGFDRCEDVAGVIAATRKMIRTEPRQSPS